MYCNNLITQNRNNVVESLQDWQVRSWCDGNTDIEKYCGPKGASPLDANYPFDNTTVTADGAAYMRQAYFATVSWTDANIGKILDAFEATPFMPNTVIAFWVCLRACVRLRLRLRLVSRHRRLGCGCGCACTCLYMRVFRLFLEKSPFFFYLLFCVHMY